MKHIKVQTLILMGFLLVALPANGVKEPTKGNLSQSPLLNFWQVLQISANQTNNDFIALDELLDETDLNKVNIQLNSRYPYPGLPSGVFPIEYALLRNNVQLANHLIRRGASVDNLSPNSLTALIGNQPTIADRAWIISTIKNREFANNLILNILINTGSSKQNKVELIKIILEEYKAEFESWCIEGLTLLKRFLENPYYNNIININTLFRSPDQGGLLVAAISEGCIGFAYWLAGHGADVNDSFAYVPPIRELISNMCENQKLTDGQFNNCIALLILMLQKGANVYMPGKDSFNALKTLDSFVKVYKHQNNQMMLERYNQIVVTIKKYMKIS